MKRMGMRNNNSANVHSFQKRWSKSVHSSAPGLHPAWMPLLATCQVVGGCVPEQSKDGNMCIMRRWLVKQNGVHLPAAIVLHTLTNNSQYSVLYVYVSHLHYWKVHVHVLRVGSRNVLQTCRSIFAL